MSYYSILKVFSEFISDACRVRLQKENKIWFWIWRNLLVKSGCQILCNHYLITYIACFINYTYIIYECECTSTTYTFRRCLWWPVVHQPLRISQPIRHDPYPQEFTVQFGSKVRSDQKFTMQCDECFMCPTGHQEYTWIREGALPRGAHTKTITVGGACSTSQMNQGMETWLWAEKQVEVSCRLWKPCLTLKDRWNGQWWDSSNKINNCSK